MQTSLFQDYIPQDKWFNYDIYQFKVVETMQPHNYTNDLYYKLIIRKQTNAIKFVNFILSLLPKNRITIDFNSDDALYKRLAPRVLNLPLIGDKTIFNRSQITQLIKDITTPGCILDSKGISVFLSSDVS